MNQYEICEYVSSSGKNHFKDWFSSLKDKKAISVILSRLARVRLGLFGDSKSLGDGVHELKIDFGPGYRIYFGNADGKLVLLLSGSSKKDQNRSIELAKRLWEEFKMDNEDAS